MPNQTNDGLFICRLSELKNVVARLQDMWKQRRKKMAWIKSEQALGFTP